MPVTSVIGAQWGDEGKGKIVDLLAREADIVARSAGGSNAGHTIVNEHGTFKFHALPSGSLYPDVLNVVGTGTVVDFDSLIGEIGQIRDAQLPDPNLLISDRAHVVMPFHKELDRVKDASRGSLRIGTTGQGIGPAYASKVERTGIQTGELLDLDALRPRLDLLLNSTNQMLTAAYDAPAMSLDFVLDRLCLWAERFASAIAPTYPTFREALSLNKRILIEGQLGIMRDLDWGTYPYVTSSTTFAAGAGSGIGIPPRHIRDAIGIAKAYTTAVGQGPFPTELFGAEADHLREKGNEFGATTGRPRRIGWFDAFALKYAVAIGAFTELALTKLDILGGIDVLKVAVGYELDGVSLEEYPHPSVLSRVLPVYIELPGWEQQVVRPKSWSDLPVNAQQYVRKVEELAGIPVTMIGVGEDREAIVRLP